MARNSKVIIASNIKLDRDYNNVVNYTEQQMLALVNANKVAESTNCSFIRSNSHISTPFTYSQCLHANYIAFQNPDYDNKWFFGWIDDVIYKSNGTAELSFTIDAWSTWFSNLTLKDCFIVREHVEDDTIGLHTVPENVELGDYVNESVDYYNGLDEKCYVLLATEIPSGDENPKTLATNFGGVPYARRCLC